MGNQSLATDQTVENDLSTSVGVSMLTNPTRTWTVALPYAQAAFDYAESLLWENTGPYHPYTNSCLSYCGNVLNAGNLNVPVNSTMGTAHFLNSLGQ